MTAYIDDTERVTVYIAYCDECEWEGETYLDMSDAQAEVDMHNETCTDGEDEPDKRTPRQKYQSELDRLAEAGLTVIGRYVP